MTTLIPKYEKSGSTTNRPINEKFAEFVSVLDYGADSTGATDSSSAITNAINTGKAVYFPKGTYKCNISINTKTVLYGDGSLASIIKPFSYSSPAMIYTYVAQQTPVISYWNYHTEIRNLGFEGTGTGASATGIGFSFGTGTPATYTTGAEYANNVTFYNCFFRKLEKGVQFPFGNIGSAFYSCGFQENYYGVYMLNNKSGSGDTMHAGNKYFYNGEFDANVCAVYVNNTQDGFGGINFTDTIIEYNNIGVYLVNTLGTITPVQFNDCWMEGNGLLVSGGPATVTIDVWTGNVKTTATVDVATLIIYNDLTLINGGFVSGVFLKSNNSRVFVKGSRVETTAGYQGQGNQITYADSNIFFENCVSGSGYSVAGGYSGNAQCVGFNTSLYPNSTSSLSTIASRFSFVPVSYAVRTGSGLNGLSQTFITTQNYSGTSAGSGTLLTTANPPKYVNCNQFSFTFANSSQYYYPLNTEINVPSATWIAFTCDVYVNSASSTLNILFSDLSANNAGQIQLGVEAVWRTIAGVAYIPSGATLRLYFGTTFAQTVVVKLSAFQCKYFATQGEAQNFIAAKTYME
jgi:hypothetical protein